MRRRITALLVGTAAVLSLVSCGEGKESSVRPINIQENATAAIQTTTEPPTQPSAEQTTFHERHDYEDGVLVGQWEGTEADIELSDNGKVTAEFDISEIMMIDNDGTFNLSGDEEPKADYDGTTLTLYAKGEEEGDTVEFLRLRRADEPVPDSYDGLYEIETADFKDRLAGLFIGEGAADIDVQIKIRYGNFIVRLPDFCEYTQNGDSFTLTLPNSVDGGIAEELSDSTFVLDGNKVTFYNSEGIAEQFEKKE